VPLSALHRAATVTSNHGLDIGKRPNRFISVHHVHHLCSRIPFYRLPRVLRDHPELRGVSRLTLLQSFQCVRLVLWRLCGCHGNGRSAQPP
jgi:acyl-lipid omega-6 desaturase (Delta-12 desaturase)